MINKGNLFTNHAVTILDLLRENRRILIGSVSSTIARITTILCGLLSTGLAAKRLTIEEFGFWAILQTFMGLFSVFDFGFRSSLSNRLAATVSLGCHKTDNMAKVFFCSIFNFQLLIAIVGVVLVFQLNTKIPWPSILRVHEPTMVHYAGITMCNAIALVLLANPFTLVTPLLYAYQKVHIDAILGSIQSIVLLLLLFFLLLFGFSFPKLVFIYFLGYLLTWLARVIYVFRHLGWSPVWVPIEIQLKNVKSITRKSCEFFFLNLSAVIVSNTGTFFSGISSGLATAGLYNVIQRLFNLLIVLHFAVATAFNPVLTRLAWSGEWEEAEKKLRFSFRIIYPSIFLFGVTGIWILHPLIVEIWTGLTVRDYFLVGLFGITTCMYGWGNTNSLFLNCLGIVKAQALFSFASVPAYLLLAYWLGGVFGTYGIIIANLVPVATGALYFHHYTKKKIKEKAVFV
uniref:Polysaccharide biosynthesis protein C-terminal domain-containing protein n=1 Tax=candidate division CPR3 bacterium TaxID=2268181 RepID=A0A7V3N4Q0_UNCC3